MRLRFQGAVHVGSCRFRGKATISCDLVRAWISCVRLGARGATPPHKSNTHERSPLRSLRRTRSRRCQQKKSHQRTAHRDRGGFLQNERDLGDLSRFCEIFEAKLPRNPSNSKGRGRPRARRQVRQFCDRQTHAQTRFTALPQRAGDLRFFFLKKD